MNLYKKKNFPSTILRLYQAYGPRQKMNRFIPIIIDSCIKDKKFDCSEGSQFRDFVHVSDVVKANILAMESDVSHSFFNVGTNSSISILELANTVIESAGLDIEPIHGPSLPGDVHKTLADIQLIKEKLSWSPTIRLENWVKEIITSNKIDEV